MYSDLLRTLAANDELKASGRVHTGDKTTTGAATIGADLSRGDHFDTRNSLQFTNYLVSSFSESRMFSATRFGHMGVG